MSKEIAPIASKLSLNVSDFTAGVARAEADAARLAKKLEQQNKNFGLKAPDLKIAQLADKGVSADQIAKLKALNAQLEESKAKAAAAAKAQADAASQAAHDQARAHAITEATLTPMQKHVAKQAELNALLKQGLISQQTFMRAVEQSAAAATQQTLSGQKQGLKGVTDLLKGGGAIAAFRIIGEQLNAQFDAVIKVQAEVAKGSLTVAEGIQEGGLQMARSLPVIGEWFRAGEKIRAMLSGQTAAQEKLNRELAEHEERVKKQSSHFNALNEGAADAEQAAEALFRNTQASLARTPGDRIRLKAKFDFDDTMKQAAELQKQLDGILSDPADAKANAGGIERLQNAIASLKSEAGRAFGLAQGEGRAADTQKFMDMFFGIAQEAERAGKSVRQLLEEDLTREAERAGLSLEDVSTAIQKFDEGERAKKAAENMQRVADAVADLQEQVDQMDMTEAQRKLDDLARSGASPEQLAKAKALLDQLNTHKGATEAQDKLKQMQSEAASIFNATRTPLEKYDAKITKLGELLDADAINWDTYGRAVQQAREELETPTKSQTSGAPELVFANSARAQQLAYQAARGQSAGDEVGKRQLTTQLAMSKTLDRIATNTEPRSEEEVTL